MIVRCTQTSVYYSVLILICNIITLSRTLLKPKMVKKSCFFVSSECFSFFSLIRQENKINVTQAWSHVPDIKQESCSNTLLVLYCKAWALAVTFSKDVELSIFWSWKWLLVNINIFCFLLWLLNLTVWRLLPHPVLLHPDLKSAKYYFRGNFMICSWGCKSLKGWNLPKKLWMH